MENIVNNINTEVTSTNPERLHTVLIVSFETTKKRYYFEVLGNKRFKKNDRVIVETIRGTELGIASNDPIQMKEKDLVLPIKPVLKLANEKEIEIYNLQRKEADDAFIVCKEKIQDHQLEMKLVACKNRIELRQIGVRDEARILGNIGPCGKELCCKTFINKFDSVSVKMARDQGLVINPTKISGVCGRLLCCINYEYTQYEEALKDFPAVNQIVKTDIGEGKVVSISPLNNFLYVDVEDKGISRFDIKDIKFNRKEASILKNMKTEEEIENKILEKE